MGGIMVFAGVVMLAEHAGMSHWKASMVGGLIGIGLLLAISGRLKDW
jgi:hypothetical protein